MDIKKLSVLICLLICSKSTVALSGNKPVYPDKIYSVSELAENRQKLGGEIPGHPMEYAGTYIFVEGVIGYIKREKKYLLFNIKIDNDKCIIEGRNEGKDPLLIYEKNLLRDKRFSLKNFYQKKKWDKGISNRIVLYGYFTDQYEQRNAWVTGGVTPNEHGPLDKVKFVPTERQECYYKKGITD